MQHIPHLPSVFCRRNLLWALLPAMLSAWSALGNNSALSCVEELKARATEIRTRELVPAYFLARSGQVLDLYSQSLPFFYGQVQSESEALGTLSRLLNGDRLAVPSPQLAKQLQWQSRPTATVPLPEQEIAERILHDLTALGTRAFLLRELEQLALPEPERVSYGVSTVLGEQGRELHRTEVELLSNPMQRVALFLEGNDGWQHGLPFLMDGGLLHPLSLYLFLSHLPIESVQRVCLGFPGKQASGGWVCISFGERDERGRVRQLQIQSARRTAREIIPEGEILDVTRGIAAPIQEKVPLLGRFADVLTAPVEEAESRQP